MNYHASLVISSVQYFRFCQCFGARILRHGEAVNFKIFKEVSVEGAVPLHRGPGPQHAFSMCAVSGTVQGFRYPGITEAFSNQALQGSDEGEPHTNPGYTFFAST